MHCPLLRGTAILFCRQFTVVHCTHTCSPFALGWVQLHPLHGRRPDVTSYGYNRTQLTVSSRHTSHEYNRTKLTASSWHIVWVQSYPTYCVLTSLRMGIIVHNLLRPYGTPHLRTIVPISLHVPSPTASRVGTIVPVSLQPPNSWLVTAMAVLPVRVGTVPCTLDCAVPPGSFPTAACTAESPGTTSMQRTRPDGKRGWRGEGEGG